MSDCVYVLEVGTGGARERAERSDEILYLKP